MIADPGQTQPQEAEPAAEIAIISRQTASAKACKAFWHGGVWGKGDRTGDQGVHESCELYFLSVLVQQEV